MPSAAPPAASGGWRRVTPEEEATMRPQAGAGWRPVAPEEEAGRAMSTGEAFAQGALQGAAGSAGMLDLPFWAVKYLGDRVPGLSAVTDVTAYPSRKFRDWATGGTTFADVAGGLADVAREKLGMGPYARAESRLGRFVERSGEAVGALAATAPMALAGAPARLAPLAGRAGIEIAAGQTGAAAGQAAEEAGLPRWMQIGASLLGSLGPGLASRANTIRGASRAAAETAETAGYGTTGSVTRRAARQLQDLYDEPGRVRVLDQLDETLGNVPPGVRPPPTVQAAYPQAGANAARLQRTLDVTDPEFSGQLASARDESMQGLRAARAELDPGVSPFEVPGSYRAAREASEEGARRVWQGVDWGRIPPARSSDVAGEVQDFLSGVSTANERYLPRAQIRDLLERIPESHGGLVPAREIQDVRSQLLNIERAGRVPTAPIHVQQQARLAGQLARRMEGWIDDPQWREGLAATAEHKALYAPRSAVAPMEAGVARAAETSAPAVVRRAISGAGGRPADVARRARQVVGNDEALASATLDELLPIGTFEAGSGKRLTRLMDAASDPEKWRAVEVLLGSPQRAERLRQIGETLRRSKWGVEGTQNAAQATGSFANAIPIVQAVRHLSRGNIIGASREMMSGPIGGWIADHITGERDVQRLVQEALLDPRVFRDLMHTPTGAQLAGWETRMSSYLARGGVREALRESR